MSKKSKKPWPTKAVMEQIYDKHFWGGKEFDFYSGDGSHEASIVTPYLQSVSAFLKNQNPKLSVCDLGCGDFNIGNQLTQYTKHYHAIDIVAPLIERNRKLYQSNNIEFYCLDISKDDIPLADCVILRQVLQHLSNTEIQDILYKIAHYKYIILTEHIPLSKFTPNKDIIAGQGIRLKQQSGVLIQEPPFNFKTTSETVLNEHILPNKMGRIITTLYTT